MRLATSLRGIGLTVALASSAGAQTTWTSVPGRVVDLTRDAAGEVLFCTEEGTVGRVAPDGTVTTIADAVSGPFPCDLVALAPTPAGDVAVLDACSDVHLLPGGSSPAVLAYSDPYIINVPSDLIVDGAGNFVTVAQTATSGVRALQWVSPDGSAWAYYTIERDPVAVAALPSGDLVVADTLGGGDLRGVDTLDAAHPTYPLAPALNAGFSLAGDDGDLAVEADGDVLVVGAGALKRWNAQSGTSTTLASGLGTLRGLTVAASSGGAPSATGWSAYLAQGAGPNTTLLEVGGVDAPADVIPASLGEVPGPGLQRLSFFDLHAFDLETDASGNLLLGGHQWGANPRIRRVELPSLDVSLVAGPADGLAGRVETLHVDPSGTIWAATSAGTVLRVEETGGAPLVTTHYDDPLDLVGTANDLAYDRDGTLWVGNRFGWSSGSLVEVAPNGTAATLLSTEETRGVTADPFHAALLLTEWIDGGFAGDVDRYDPDTGSLQPVPGFDGLNLSNESSRGDGKACVDVLGNVYLTSMDDFSVQRYEPATGRLVRVGSGYVDRPTGVAIARSIPGSGSTTGWSLYVAEWYHLWEIPSVPPPAPVHLDRAAPPLERAAGWIAPSHGTPRALIAHPEGDGLVLSTSFGRLLGLDPATGEVELLAQTPQLRDLVGLAAADDGMVVVAATDGRVFELDPGAGWVPKLLYDDAANVLEDVRGVAIDVQGRVLLVEGTDGVGAAVLRLDDGALETLAHAAGGRRAARDPLTGDVFVSEAGTGLDSGGQLLRVDGSSVPARYGHHRTPLYDPLPVGELDGVPDGGLAFSAAGDLYVALASEGRVWRLDRSTGTRVLAAGNLDRPVDLALAAGTPGVAGAGGTSLFVLDGPTVWETGVAGQPAPLGAPTGGAPAQDLAVVGLLQPGATLPVEIDSPADAGRTFLVVPSLTGKEPGLPLALLGNPSDPRVLPSNLSPLWSLGLVGVLDGAGASPPGLGFPIPNDPALLGFGQFLELAWMALDPFEPNGVATVGGTAHVYLGE